MNEILKATAEKWLTELGIITLARPTCLLVDKKQVDDFCGGPVLLQELRFALNTNKLFFRDYDHDNQWLYLDSF